MSEEFGPDDAAERERQVHNDTPEPTFGEPDRPVTRCEATYGTTEYRCTGAAGHTDDHTAYSATTGDLEWSDADSAKPLPQREPGAALGCSSVSPHGDACTLTRGHGGMHETHWLGERTASWADTDPGRPQMRVTALNPQPVRVRFVDLPHRNVPRQVFGVPAHTIEPGGFALVVDRFKHLAHLEGEREFWEAFGATIGAKTVLLYPGQLDIVAVDWE